MHARTHTHIQKGCITRKKIPLPFVHPSACICCDWIDLSHSNPNIGQMQADGCKTYQIDTVMMLCVTFRFISIGPGDMVVICRSISDIYCRQSICHFCLRSIAPSIAKSCAQPWKSQPDQTFSLPTVSHCLHWHAVCSREPNLVPFRAFLKQHRIGFKSDLTTRTEIKKLAKVAYFQLNIAYESSETINRTLKNVTRK